MMSFLSTVTGVDLPLGSEGLNWLFDGFEFFLFLSVGWFKLHLFFDWLFDLLFMNFGNDE
jgi:hypothetical protein